MSLFFKMMVVCFIVCAPQFLRADMKFVEWILFSDKAYAKDMEVYAYILTQEQACAALKHSSQEIIQSSNKELINKDAFLFIKVKNNGKKHAWGTLACKVPTYSPMKISAYGVGRSSKKDYSVYLMELGPLKSTLGDTGTPKISIEWDELYTK